MLLLCLSLCPQVQSFDFARQLPRILLRTLLHLIPLPRAEQIRQLTLEVTHIRLPLPLLQKLHLLAQLVDAGVEILLILSLPLLHFRVVHLLHLECSKLA
jgi:hypothetical protein